METKKSKNNDNNNGKKDIEGNNNDHRSQYTYDSSDAKEIMTGVGGGEEGSTFPDSDKYIVEDIKKAIKDENSEFSEEEEEESSSKRGSEQSNNKDENN